MAAFKFRCVFCRQKIEAQEEWIGMFAECPDCHRRIEIRRDDEFLSEPPKALPGRGWPPKAPDAPSSLPESVSRPAAAEVPPPLPPEVPPPLPKPFKIDLPKWELPKEPGK